MYVQYYADYSDMQPMYPGMQPPPYMQQPMLPYGYQTY